MFRKQSEKATCRPKRLITGQGGERRSCGQEGRNRRAVFRDSGWNSRGESAGDGRRRRRKSDGGCRVRCAVCADGSFSLKTCFFGAALEAELWLWFNSYSQNVMQLTLKVSIQYAHTWGILLHHNVTYVMHLLHRNG